MHKDILVIDDNPDIRFLICNILKEQSFNVRSAANYDQAVLEINRKLPDLAIVDIKLDKTDKDGIDLLKSIVKKNRISIISQTEEFEHSELEPLEELQEAPDTGGASASRQPYQPIPRTDEPTLQEMTNAPSLSLIHI